MQVLAILEVVALAGVAPVLLEVALVEVDLVAALPTEVVIDQATVPTVHFLLK